MTSLAVALVWGVAFGGPLASADDENAGADAEQRDPWATYRHLTGTWEGTIEGRLGQGTGSRQYELIFNDQFLLGRHASIRLPQPQSSTGDYHHELSVYSLDSERNTVVLRQFIIEGYVLRFACETNPKGFVCVTEDVENGPDMAARMTIEFENRYQYTELFELAEPGGQLQVLVKSTWTREPSLQD